MQMPYRLILLERSICHHISGQCVPEIMQTARGSTTKLSQSTTKMPINVYHQSPVSAQAPILQKGWTFL